MNCLCQPGPGDRSCPARVPPYPVHAPQDVCLQFSRATAERSRFNSRSSATGGAKKGGEAGPLLPGVSSALPGRAGWSDARAVQPPPRSRTLVLWGASKVLLPYTGNPDQCWAKPYIVHDIDIHVQYNGSERARGLCGAAD